MFDIKTINLVIDQLREEKNTQIMKKNLIGESHKT